MQKRAYKRRPGKALAKGADLDPNGFAAALAKERGFIVISETEALIPLGRRRKLPKAWVRVSREDAHLGAYYWSPNPYNYVRRRDAAGATTFLHREICGLVTGDERVVDHMNRDVWDNRRENLRVVTTSQNAQNQVARPTSTSSYRGVSLRGHSGRWVVMHTKNGKAAYGGTFDTEAEANEAAVAWRAEHMPYAID